MGFGRYKQGLKQGVKAALTAAARHYNERVPRLAPSEWGLSVSGEGHLLVQGLDLTELTKRWGSPLHVVDADALRRNAAAFLEAPPGGPACEVYYSYKTNPIPGVLRVLHGLGVGAEVISAFELWLAFRLGVPPEKIIYNGPVKSEASLEEAMRRGIGLINANHAEEVEVLRRMAARLGCRPRIGVRVTTSGSWAGQFGSPIDTGEALETLQAACRSGVLDVCALHAHLGAPIRRAEQVSQFATELLDLAAEGRRAFGFELRALDLGGSLSVPTVDGLGDRERRLNMAILAELVPPVPANTLTIREYVRAVSETVTEYSSKIGVTPPRIILEPGRAMTGNTQILVTTVHSIKAARRGPPFAILDAGINLAQSVQSEYHQIFASSRMHAAPRQSYRLAGPICSPGDVLSWACRLPELFPGDQLAVMDAGAYFVPFSTSFSFPRPAIVLVEGGRAALLRRAEVFEDLVALDEPPQDHVPT